ncbi:ABC transporter permease [uncultured Aeromicrobium sp.]|uniref:ABC transporter permease n=1 Tax=uncultured Aeromicrobium sp. TaxID=337820 RepID=UPI0025EA32A2|nr:ABC transporter permease [uncultured Aeromicrobium sp.]
MSGGHQREAVRQVTQAVTYSILPTVVAIVAALVMTSVVVWATGAPIGGFVETMLSVPGDRDAIIIVNQASMIALSAFAAAICFRMGLFNIGVEGQYIVGACAGAFFAGSGIVPGPLNILATLVVAMVAGVAWAMIAALLNVTRGVSEVISAIMLNYVALTLAGYLVKTYGERSGYTFTTPQIPPSSQPLGFSVFAGAPDVWALAVLAVLVGLGYSFLLGWTRFGFDLRTTGESRTAALANGIDPRRMVLVVMAISGAVAGLVWMPSFFGSTHTFGIPEYFQRGLGFTGLAVALLGRNTSLGIGFGSLLFAFLATQSNRLQSVGVARDVVEITQGIVVLMVVIAFEIARRVKVRREQERVARELEPAATTGATA